MPPAEESELLTRLYADIGGTGDVPEELLPCLPRDKSDEARARCAVSLGFPAVQPELVKDGSPRLRHLLASDLRRIGEYPSEGELAEDVRVVALEILRGGSATATTSATRPTTAPRPTDNE